MKKIILLLIVLIIMSCTENNNSQLSSSGKFRGNDPFDDFRSGEYSGALLKFLVIIEKNPNDLYTKSLIAYCYLQTGGYKNSKKIANQVVNEISTDLIKTNSSLRIARAWALLTLGEVKMHNSDVREARQIIKEAIKTGPLLATPHAALGDILCIQRQYKEAMAAYDMALKIDPKYERALGGKIKCLYSLGEYSEALKIIECALRESPKSHYILKERGIIFFELKNYSELVIYSTS
jgi:tetratricopeptide (TPR) repeat protein